MSRQRKTFLFITDTDYERGKITGAHKRFLELVKGVCKNNNVILLSRKIPELEKYNIKKILIKKKKKSFLPAHIDRIITIVKALHKEKKNIKYDYAVSFGPTDTICYGLSGYRNITTLFREDFLGYKKSIDASSIKMLYFGLIEKYAVRHSDKIIVQCEDDRNALLKRYSSKIKDLKSKIYVQINNVNASWMPSEKNIKRKNDDGVVRVSFIGNFSDRRKGHDILLPAVARLIDEGINVELKVAGDGEQLSDCRAEYKKYENIIFLGRIKNATELLAESDFEVVPSLMDSCPNTVLEGISVGTTVYGSNIGGIKDILQDRNYLFNPDVESVYKFIKNKITTKAYIDDKIKQKNIKKRLTFDWCEKIIGIIEEKNKEYT